MIRRLTIAALVLVWILGIAIVVVGQGPPLVRSVETIADLANLNPGLISAPGNKLTVRVLGAQSINDGRGATYFRISALPDGAEVDGTNYIASAHAGYWQRVTQNVGGINDAFTLQDSIANNLTFSQTPRTALRSFGPGFSTLHVLGNSIPSGGTVTDLSHAYGQLVATNLGLQQNLLSNPSFNVSDVNWSSFDGWLKTNTHGGVTYTGAAPSTIDTNTIVLLDNWYNDVRGGATTTQWINGVRHLIHWWGIPHSAKRFAQSADSRTGTWTNNTFIGQGNIGLVGVSNGATLTFTNVVGSEIIVSYLGWATAAGGTITVTIDGSAQTPISTASAAYGNREFVNGSDPNIPDYVGPYGNGKLDFCPQAVVYAGLGHSAHTVTITASNTGVGGAHVLWVAGNGWASQPRTGPIVLCPSTPSQGVWTAGGSDARQASFNKAIQTEIRAAQARGIRVIYAPLAEAIDPYAYVNDGVHWNNAGHVAAAQAFLSPFALDLPYAAAVRLPGGGDATTGGLGEFAQLSLNTTFSKSSGSDNGILYGYIVNQSGTAVARGIQLYATETSLGSGGHNYISLDSPTGVKFYITGAGRIVSLPTPVSGGTPHTLGAGGVTSSRILLYGSDSAKNAALVLTGDAIYSTQNSDSTPKTLFVGAAGTTTQVLGSMTVAQGPTTLNASMSAASGSDNALIASYTINQSGSATARGLHLYATETALGSGGHRFINASGPSGDRFYVLGSGRIIALPPAASGGTAHRLGAASTAASAILLYSSDSGIDAEMSIRGNSIASRRNTDGVATNMTIGLPGAVVTHLGDLSVNGSFGVGSAASPIKQFRHGTATLTAGAATVNDSTITSATRIFLTSQSDGGTPGWLRVSARTSSTSFTITSSSGTDTSTVAYLLIEP